MTDLHTAARMALEALYAAHGALGHQDNKKIMETAIAAIREALAHCDRCGKPLGTDGHIHTCTPRRHISYVCPQCDASMVPDEQPQQGCSECGVTSTDDSMYALYCVACIDKMQPQQEPVENRFVRELREYAKTNEGAWLFPRWDVHRALKYLDGYTAPPQRQHITDGSPCWCNPETTYTDPETGASVIVHKDPQ